MYKDNNINITQLAFNCFESVDINSSKDASPQPDISIDLNHFEVELMLDCLRYYKKEVTSDKAQRWAGNESKIMNGIIEKMRISQDRIIDKKLFNFETGVK